MDWSAIKNKYFLLAKKIKKAVGYFSSLGEKAKNAILQPEPEDVNEQLLIQLNRKRIPSWSQIKQLPKFLNKVEKFQLTAALVIIFIAVATLSWRFYVKNSIAVPAHGGSYIEGLIGSPNLINPMFATNDVDRDLVRLIFSGLMKVDQEGKLVPDLAKAYTIDAEQTTYTFELRENLKWHNGEPLTADDVLFTINSIKNPDYKSPFRSSFGGIAIQKLNDQTVQFKLEEPFDPFLSILTIGIIPEHLWYSVPAVGINLADFNIRPVGSGPYQFKSFTRDSSGIIKSYTLESYKDYHLGNPNIEEITFKFYSDYQTAVTALENKNVEGLLYLPKEYKQVLKSRNINYIDLNFPQYTAVFFNPNQNEALRDIELRQALALAIDKERILTEVLNGDGQTINSPILSGMTGYDQQPEGRGYDPEAARSMLDELGWVIPQGQAFRINEEDLDEESDQDEEAEVPQELTINLTTIDQSEYVKAVSIIKEEWEAIGIKTELNIVPKDRIKKEVVEPRQYQAFVFGEVININSGPYAFWHSSQTAHPGLNLSVMANKDIDDYLEKIQEAGNQDQKLEALKNFQSKLLELQFAIFLYNPTYTYPVAEKIKGVDNLKFINLPADRFNNITQWYIKTKRKLNTNE